MLQSSIPSSSQIIRVSSAKPGHLFVLCSLYTLLARVSWFKLPKCRIISIFSRWTLGPMSKTEESQDNKGNGAPGPT